MSELYNVYQWFPDGSYEKFMENVSAEEAVIGAFNLTRSVGGQLGTIERIIITDSLDLTNFEWVKGKGVIFPPRGIVRDD